MLLLSQAVVVLVGRRIKSCRNTVTGAFLILISLVCCRIRAIWKHGPTPHRQQWLAGGGCHRDGVVARAAPAIAGWKVNISQFLIDGIEWKVTWQRQVLRRNANDQLARSDNVV